MGATATTGAHTLQFLPHLRVALPADEIVEGKYEIVDGKDRKNIINPAETTSQDPPTGRASGRGCSLGGRQRRRCGPARTRPSSHDSKWRGTAGSNCSWAPISASRMRTDRTGVKWSALFDP
uniref:Uncharacterized protein n=1 Tax=Oryza glumipatula TaxID=40148 RepID=A0A0E0BHQ8_9ORYZ